MHSQDSGFQAGAAETVSPLKAGQTEKRASKKPVTVTAHGITVELDQEKFNDLEVFDMIDDIQSGNAFKIPKLMRHIFGDQHALIIDGLRNEQGVVTAEKASEFLVEALQQMAPNFSRS